MADGFQSSESDDEIGHHMNSNNLDKGNNDDDEINESANEQIEKEL